MAKKNYYEKKKKSKLGVGPIIALSCAGIIAVGSVGLASQGFSDWKWLTQEPDIASNVRISSDYIFGCENNPAENFSIVQAKNGRIRVSTDGHSQATLLDAEGNAFLLSPTSRIGCKVNFNSDGYVGFALPVSFDLGVYGKAVGCYLKNEGNKMSVVLAATDHTNGEKQGEFQCIENVIASAELPKVSGELDIQFNMLTTQTNGQTFAINMLVNGQKVNWLVNNESEFKSYVNTGFDGVVTLSASYSSTTPVCLDVFNVVATIEDLQFDNFNQQNGMAVS